MFRHTKQSREALFLASFFLSCLVIAFFVVATAVELSQE